MSPGPRIEHASKEGLGLCVSGGGYRASLFHLGVLKRLHEVGILPAITHLSSVSGGTILAAAYCQWLHHHPGRFDFDAFARHFIRCIKRNYHLWYVALGLGTSVVEILLKSLIIFRPANPVLGAPLRRLKRAVPSFLYKTIFGFDRRIDESLPNHPRLIINTTDLGGGVSFYFCKDYAGIDEQLAFAGKPQSSESCQRIITPILPRAHTPTQELQYLPLADAVSASAAVPGLFHPYQVRIAEDPTRHISHIPRRPDDLVLELVDGGVADNQGFRVLLPNPRQKENVADSSPRCKYLIISDASGHFKSSYAYTFVNKLIEAIPLGEQVMTVYRSLAVQMHTIRDLGFDLLAVERQFTPPLVKEYALFHSLAQNSTLPRVLVEHTAEIRTDLDAFSDLEIRLLMYQGYYLMNERLNQWWKELLPDPPMALDWREINEYITRVLQCPGYSDLPDPSSLRDPGLNPEPRTLNPSFADWPTEWQRAEIHLRHSKTNSILLRYLARLRDGEWDVPGRVVGWTLTIALGLVVAWALACLLLIIEQGLRAVGLSLPYSDVWRPLLGKIVRVG